MTKGVYLLLISVGKDINVNVGSLGNLNFEKGIYAYVGSAQNNLEKRIGRHLRKVKRKFWHVDYLLNNDNVAVLKALQKEGGRPEECRIAKKISGKDALIKGFGSSDCKCKSHLFKLENFHFLEEFMLEEQ